MRKCLKGILEKGNISNPSLILHKYLEKGDDNLSKTNLMEDAQKSLENAKYVYEQAYKKWKSFFSKNEIMDLETDGSLIVGLGSDNVLETGITLHHTYGVPYIPGSALKGLAAHYCNEVWGEQAKNEDFKREKIVKETDENGKETTKKDTGKYYKEIFGDNTQAGHIIFWDAWITPDKLIGCLKKDIMTPHNTNYYSNNDSLPSDYESPNPISFLSVEGIFTVALSCDVSSAEGKKWVELTFKLLKSALKEWGVGAKTSSGYGRLDFIGKNKDIPQILPKTNKSKTDFNEKNNKSFYKNKQNHKPYDSENFSNSIRIIKKNK